MVSVVICVLAEDTAILAADKRMVNLETGKTTSETINKILPLNKHVAFSAVGNAGVAVALMNMLVEGNKEHPPGVVENSTVDDFSEIVDYCIEMLYEQHEDAMSQVRGMIILAGKARDGTAVIKWRTSEEPLWETIKGSESSITFRVFYPSDLTMEQCNQIVSSKIEDVRGTDRTIIHALQRAIKEIAVYSSSVNGYSDIWICDK